MSQLRPYQLSPRPMSSLTHSTKALQELVGFVRQTSEFYRQLYGDVHDNDHFSLEELPPLEHTSFWLSNTCETEDNRVLTGSVLDGGIFRTGGTTSDPKVSFYSRTELHSITHGLADCLVRAGLQPGDRVANLLSNGELSMGYWLNVMCWSNSSIPYVQLPIGTLNEVERMVWPMRDFRATSVISLPTVLIRISEYLVSRSQSLPRVQLIVYGGETLHREQRQIVAKGFPNAAVRPLMYGSVDGGLIGIPTHDEGLESRYGGPVYEQNSPAVVVEILDEDGKPLKKTGVKGLLYVTNLTRRLMPVLRYPTGDAAEWVDYDKRLFTLRGRDIVGFKIGRGAYDFRHVRDLVIKTLGEQNVIALQAVARMRDAKDELVLRIASTLTRHDGLRDALERTLKDQTPRFASCLETGTIHALAVEWVRVEEMHVNLRTGKLRDVIDERPR